MDSVEGHCIMKQLLIHLVSGPPCGAEGGRGVSTDETHGRLPRKFEIRFTVGADLVNKPQA